MKQYVLALTQAELSAVMLCLARSNAALALLPDPNKKQELLMRDISNVIDRVSSAPAIRGHAIDMTSIEARAVARAAVNSISDPDFFKDFYTRAEKRAAVTGIEKLQAVARKGKR